MDVTSPAGAPLTPAKLFGPAEKPAALTDGEFKSRKDRLRLELIELQQAVREAARFPVLIVLAGVRGAGVVDTLNLLNTWMDPRWIETNAFGPLSDEERERPPFWRYWRSLPPAGQVGLYLEGWYGELLGLDPSRPVGRRADERLKHIGAFEQTLADNGALILKFWLHASERQQKRKATADGDDPLMGLRLADISWQPQPPYKVYVETAAAIVAGTHTDAAPWHIVAGADTNHRRAAVLTHLRDALKRHLKHTGKKTAAENSRARKQDIEAPKQDVLAAVDLGKSLSEAAYAKEFKVQQRRLYAAHKAARERGIASVVVFEGWDAAGKGGAIRRLTYAMSAYNYRVVPISAPSEEEKKYHYLWRFWLRLGRAGHMTIFDRSWYGRVLVERVDRLIAKAAWQRAYEEIVEFEEQLTSAGIVLVKLWLHIDREEQLARLKSRKKKAHKRWKLTEDDWHNRKNWDGYVAAVNDMVKRTSTPDAPWQLIPANSKAYARIAVMEAVAEALERAAKKASAQKA